MKNVKEFIELLEKMNEIFVNGEVTEEEKDIILNTLYRNGIDMYTLTTQIKYELTMKLLHS